ncbi:hypothetical protein [Nocardia sp. NPDC004604]|uniref:hypothetical protein n=1 Tax=Nocardia sp. NPDC004604 TaxID=3157013 RepID=UPI0033A4DEE4
MDAVPLVHSPAESEVVAMYVEEFTATGVLTADAAEDLAHTAGRFTSRITVTCNGHSVHAPVLPVCWDQLRVRNGSTVSVTAERGYRPPDDEDRMALRAFVRRFQVLTAVGPVRLALSGGSSARRGRRRPW